MRPESHPLRTAAVLVLVALLVTAQAMTTQRCPCADARAAQAHVARGGCSGCELRESLPTGDPCHGAPLRSPCHRGSCCLEGKQELGSIVAVPTVPDPAEKQVLASFEPGSFSAPEVPTGRLSGADRGRTGLAPPQTPSSHSPALLPVRLT